MAAAPGGPPAGALPPRSPQPSRGALKAVDVPSPRELPTLEHVVRWAHARGLDVHDAVAMDEFTFDVLIPITDALILVFDTT